MICSKAVRFLSLQLPFAFRPNVARIFTVAVPLPMVKDRLQDVGLPVAAFNATKFTAFCAVPLPPSGGRTWEKVPPAKTERAPIAA